jgi:hypothetical protein
VREHIAPPSYRDSKEFLNEGETSDDESLQGNEITQDLEKIEEGAEPRDIQNVDLQVEITGHKTLENN